MERIYHEYEGPDCQRKNQFLYFSLCADGIEVKKNTSFTPVTAKLLNWPPEMRRLNGCILLLAYFPPKVLDYGEMFSPIANTFALHQPGKEPMKIKPGGKDTAAHADVWVVLANALSDIRGIPALTGGSNPPCYVGGCIKCEVRGVRKGTCTILPGAVRGLPLDSSLRQKYRTEFRCSKESVMRPKLFYSRAMVSEAHPYA